MAQRLNSAVQLPTKTCTTCKKEKPLDHFRRTGRFRGGHVSVCRACHADAERQGYHRRKSKAVRKITNDFVRNANKARNGSELACLANDMINRFGGYDQLAQAWHDEIHRQSQTGSPKVLSSLSVIGKLIAYTDSQRPKPSQMTDNELRTEMRFLIKKEVMADPALLEEILNELAMSEQS